jgi:hypothetical protein
VREGVVVWLCNADTHGRSPSLNVVDSATR